jgi:hypothetical protein
MEEKSLDEEWAEEPVIFGPGATPTCGDGMPKAAPIRFVPRPRSNRPASPAADR